MAASIAPLPKLKLPPAPIPVSSDQVYWRKFSKQLLIPAPANHPVTHISFPAPPPNPASQPCEQFAVTAGPRVHVFSGKTRKIVKTINRFDDIAYGGDIRYDGRVLAAGDDGGKIQVFDINSRAILRSWTEHKQPVYTTKFSPRESTVLMSTSDDKTVRLWDLPSQESTRTFIGHEDYVRTGCFLSGQASGLIVSGSYDQTVRVWDQRTPGQAVMTFKHAAAVEDVLPLPSGTTLLASAENEISVLDLVAGRPLHVIKAHQKTVTALALASQGTRLVSGGLDGHLKIYELNNWTVVSGLKYSAPILSLAVVPAGSDRADKHIVVGMTSGVLSIKTRLSGVQKAKERAREKEMQALMEGKIDAHDREASKKRPRGYEKRFRGMDFKGEGADVVIKTKTKPMSKRQRIWEIDLRKGKYAAALDHAFERNTDPVDILTLLTELRHRSALRAALRGRNEVTLQPILKWLSKHLVNPQYVNIGVDVGMLILEEYYDQLDQSEAIGALVKNLHRRVNDEVRNCQQASQTLGMLSMLAAES